MLGPILFIWLTYSIYKQVQEQKDLQQSWAVIKTSLTGPKQWKIYLVCFLMLINWGIEARKWQVLMMAIQPLSFLRSFRAIFSGQALALSTPNRVGEYAGRVVYLNDGNRLRALSLSAVGSMAQMIVTFVMGIAGLVFMYRVIIVSSPQFQGLSVFWLTGLIYVLSIITVVVILFYYNLSWLTKLFERSAIIGKYRFFIQKLEDLHNKQLTHILLLSLSRYVVFLSQYLLLMQVFDVEIAWWQASCLVCVQFLVMAIVPSIALAEVGLRGKVGIALFGMLSTNTLGIIATSAGIWVINLIIPALAGSLLILGLRILRK